MKEVINTSISKSGNVFELGNNLLFTTCRMIEFTKNLSLNIAKLIPQNINITSITLISGNGKYHGVSSYNLKKGDELTISTNFGDLEFKAGAIILILY